MIARITLVITLLLATSTAYADDAEEHLDDARSLYLAGHWEAADEAFEKAYNDIDEGTKVRAATALEWGTLHWEMGYYESAHARVREALDIAKELGLDEATGELLSTLGHIEASRGELPKAERTLNMCIQLTEELGDDVHRALCRIHRRTLLNMRGADPGPEKEFRQDIKTLANAESALSLGTSLAKSSQLYRNAHDYERAAELLDQAHQIYRSTGNVPAITRNQLRKAQLMQVRGKYDEARPLIEGLRHRFEEMNHRPMVVHALALEAADAVNRNDLETAMAHYQRALSIARDMNNPPLTGRVELALCELNTAESAQHCQRAIEIFVASQMIFLNIRAHTALARIQQAQQNYEEARNNFHTAIRLLAEMARYHDDSPYAVSLALLFANLCQVKTNLEDPGTLAICDRALERLENMDEEDQVERAELYAATVHAAARSAVQADDYSQALDYFKDAARRYEELGAPNHRVLAADILLRKGAVHSAGLRSRRKLAPETFKRGLEVTAEVDPEADENLVRTRISLFTQLTQHLMADENWSDAIDHLVTLAAEAEEAAEYRSAAWAHSALANAYLQTDRRDEAIEALETGRPLAERAEDEGLIESFENYLEQLGR